MAEGPAASVPFAAGGEPPAVAARILAGLPRRNRYFVFPSAVAAQFRLRQAAMESGGPVAADRFLAWDDFKARTLSRRQPGKRPAGTADRMIFAGSLFRENAAAREPFLKDIINPAWAGSWEAFVPALVRLLPGLRSVTGRLDGFRGAAGNDPYMEDLRLVGDRYEAWLQERRLYEAPWNRGTFDGGGREWVLFFPELAADWDEYREELERVAGSPGAGPEAGAGAAVKAAALGGSLVIVPLEAVSPPDREGPAAGAVAKAIAKAAAQAAVQAAARVLGECEGRYIRFRNSADEYRWVSLVIGRLFDAGLAPEDMAISFPGIENSGPLIRELEKRDMAVVLHEGKPLPDHGGGRIFAGLAACPASQWSFRALKNLLLDKAYPWKHRKAIDALVEFGVRFRCVSGLSERGRDMWERSFRRLGGWNLPFAVPVPEIETYYGELKRDILGLTGAKSFAALREQWHIFEGHHFDRSAMNGRTNSVIARALTALDELVEAAGGGEQENAYGIFQAYLEEKKYVHQPRRRGIPLYDYKVAAGIEPVVHFVLNMNQRDISVRNRSFLREDRQDLLGIRERDMSAAFIRAYGLSALFPVFTVSGRTAEGPTVPHRMLREMAEGVRMPAEGAWMPAEGVRMPAEELDANVLDPPEDPWAVEEALAGYPAARDGCPVTPDSLEVLGQGCSDSQYRSGRKPQTPTPSSPETPAAGDRGTAPASMQRKGWEGVAILRAPPGGGDLRIGPLADPSLRAALDRRLAARGEGIPEAAAGGAERGRRLSPTDLNEYLVCPFMWMLVRGLGIRERQTMIETIDQRELGMLYHKILERFFNGIASDENEKVYRQSRLKEYLEAVALETDQALEEARSREGAFQESVYGMLRGRINAALHAWLEKDSPALDGCEVLGGEYPLRKEYAEEGLALSGKADLVLKRSGGADEPAGGGVPIGVSVSVPAGVSVGVPARDRYVLTDFKTAVIPAVKDLLCDPDTREPPRNVQMAAYIAMLEEGRDGAADCRVETARFYSLDFRKYRKVLDGAAEAGGRLPVPRDGYQNEVDAVERVLHRAAGSLASGTYTVPARKDRRCKNCPVSSVCRANYIGGEG